MSSVPDRRVRPAAGEFAPFYAAYVARVPDGDIVDTLTTQLDHTLGPLRALPESAGGRRYAEGKWSVREVLGHLADAERIFSYRALRFARNDETELPSFDENTYIANGFFDRRTISSLCDEYHAVRQSTLHLLTHMNDVEWGRSGIASRNRMSVRALAWVMAGHELHHREILASRYL
jgi:uncharacterized damage-inducible protein DinB